VVFAIVADQATKLWAESTLASPRFPDHRVEMVVPPEHAGDTVEAYLRDELTWTSEADIDRIVGVDRPGFVIRDDRLLRPDTIVEEGDSIELQLKTTTVVDGFWDHHYARNKGAAFSLLADADETWRRGFFVLMSALAILLIGFFIHRAEDDQKLLIFSLALVLGGAIGNLIDRVAYGYVIDFIAWHYEDNYWPTFNIADAVIVAGITLLTWELFFGMQPIEEGPPKGDDEEEREATSDASSAAKGRAGS